MPEQLAELGVILLMFGVGLHFHVEELLAVRRIALPGALLQIAVATAAGALVALGFGWSFGRRRSSSGSRSRSRARSSCSAFSPITRHSRRRPGHVAVGWLLVEDMFTVLVLVLLPIAAGGAPEGGVSAASPFRSGSPS